MVDSVEQVKNLNLQNLVGTLDGRGQKIVGVPTSAQSMISTFFPNVCARLRQPASVDAQRSTSS